MKKLILFCLIVFLSSCAANAFNTKTGLYSGKVYHQNAINRQALVQLLK